jgi:pseudouridine-5'-phosphate glycosidase
MTPSPAIDIRPAVTAALREGRPVVAAPSAPIAHTISWPANLETYRQTEAVVRREGAVLAVVGVWRGQLTVGLHTDELEALAQGASAMRASRRDLAATIVKRLTAGTTVSATMYLAWRAGIRLVLSAAVGGVPRSRKPREDPGWDMSAELVELLHTPVALVSSGTRSALNLEYTAHVLETFRVPVIGYQTDYFPICYMRAGKHPVPVRSDTPAEIAALLNAHWDVGGVGAVVAQQTPAEVALSPDELLAALAEVEEQAERQPGEKKDLSPLLMDRLNRLTDGKSLRAYQAIIAANAQLAAQIGWQLSRK